MPRQKEKGYVYMNNLKGKALAEYLLRYPENANRQCAWHTLCLKEWVRLLNAHPEWESFRPQPPPGYTRLGVAELIDLYNEFQEDLNRFAKNNK